MLSVLQPDTAHIVAPSSVGHRRRAADVSIRDGLGAAGPCWSCRIAGCSAHVHPSEDQAVLDPFQGGHQRGIVCGVGVPLPTGLVRAADALGLRARQGTTGLGQLAVQLAVGEIDGLLLTA